MSLLKLTSTSSAGVEDDKEELAKKRSEVTELLFNAMPPRVIEGLDAAKARDAESFQRPFDCFAHVLRSVLLFQENGRCAVLYEHLQSGVEDLSRRFSFFIYEFHRRKKFLQQIPQDNCVLY